MKNKLMVIFLITVLAMLSLVIITGCGDELGYLIDRSQDKDVNENKDISDQNKKAIDEAVAEAEEEMKEEELTEGFEEYPGEEIEEGQLSEEEQLIEGFEEEERILPNEPVTYNGDMDGVDIALIINFKTTKVSGTVSSGGDQYVDAAIDGIINIETFLFRRLSLG